MSSVLTNRLVGSAILLIAAVVFLPDLLDGQKEVHKDDFQAVPERPEFANVTEPVELNSAQHLAARAAAQQLPTDPEPLDIAAANTAEIPTELAGSQPSQAIDLVATPAPIDNNVQTGTLEKPLQVSATHSDASSAVPPTANKSEPASSAQQGSQVERSAAERTPAAATVSSATPVGQTAYVVKVGSFSKSQNAEQLVAKLKAAGFAAFSRKIRSAQGAEMVSVLVGPDLNKSKLESRIAQLQVLAQVQNLKVSTYQVVENN